MIKRSHPAKILVALLAVVMVTAVRTPSEAAAPDSRSVQAQINAHLAAYPGGTQINATEVSYAGGTFVMTFARPGGAAIMAADCPSGWFCFYDQVNYGYPRGKLSSCGWQDLAWWGWLDRIESVYYNMSTGSVSFINHGDLPNHSHDDVIFSVSTSMRGDSDVSPYRNTADHVYRFC